MSIFKKIPVMFKLEGDKVVSSVSIVEVVKFLNEKIYEYDKTHYAILCKNGPYRIIDVQPGNKYIKLVEKFPGNPRGDSVYGFLDWAGNIYRAAGWKAPAKHVRGSVFDKDFSWGKAFHQNGVAYLR